VCDDSVFGAAVRHAVRQSAAARQSVSESIQNGFKFRFTFHKSTFFRPEEAAPWLGRCKNTDHRTVDFRTCAAHTSRVGVIQYAVCVLHNICSTARTVLLSKTSPRASIQAARSRAYLHGAAAPDSTSSVCSFQSHSRVLRADRGAVDGAAASPGRGQEREAGGGRVAGALRLGADAAAEEAPVRARAGRAGWMRRV
jgi:hypothetical protein